MDYPFDSLHDSLVVLIMDRAVLGKERIVRDETLSTRHNFWDLLSKAEQRLGLLGGIPLFGV